MERKVVENRDTREVDRTFVEDECRNFPLKENDLRRDMLILGMFLRWDPI
jgi:hypothetical protein